MKKLEIGNRIRKAWMPLCFATLLLGGCTQGIGAVKYGIQTDADFNELVLEDVRQAILLATQASDELALMCWSYLEEFTIANTPGTETEAGKVVGVFSAYQKGRNVRRLVIEVEISDRFRLECGPMLTDSMGALGRLGVRIAL